MQDKDSEVLNYQRKRRKRITKIRYSIILIVAGWIVLSMILVVVLFVKMTSLEHKLDQLVTSSSEQNTDQINAGAAADLNGGAPLRTVPSPFGCAEMPQHSPMSSPSTG